MTQEIEKMCIRDSDNTGEVITLHPAVKMAKQSYTIKFK